MVLVAMRQQDQIVHDSDNDSIGRHMLQLMEHVIKFIKKHCRQNCNHRDGWMLRLMKYMDCVTIGSIGYDLIDFKECKHVFNQQWKKIYDPLLTPQMETDLIEKMPNKWKQFWQIIHKIKFRDPIPEIVARIWRQHLAANNQDFESMRNNQDENSYMGLLNHNLDDLSNDDESMDEATGAIMSQLSKKEMWKRLQQQTQRHSQSQSQSQAQM